MNQQNWAAELLGYRFDIMYKPGLENTGADPLSRMYGKGKLIMLAHYPK